MVESGNSRSTSSGLSSLPATLPETVLRLKKCLLRRHRQSDAEAIAKEANNPNVAARMSDSFPHPYTIEDAKKWISLTNSGSPPLGFVICGLEDNVAIGGVGISEKDEADGTTMLVGYWLGENHWGQGIATEAAAAITEWSFANFHDLQRMEGEVDGGNDMSCRVLEKAGFVFQERRRNAIRKGERDLDVLVYRKTRLV